MFSGVRKFSFVSARIATNTSRLTNAPDWSINCRSLSLPRKDVAPPGSALERSVVPAIAVASTCRQFHNSFLGQFIPVQDAGQPALPHHQHPVAHADNLRQF